MKISVKLTLSGILSALALLAFMLESLFPPIILPGAKLGLSNVFILFAAIVLGGKYAYLILLVKIILGSLFSGNPSAITYSMPSGIISLTIELLLIKYVKTSVLAVSACGSLINITVQNLVFCLVTNTFEYLSFLPYLSLIGIASGLLVGFAVYLAVKKLPLEKFYKT